MDKPTLYNQEVKKYALELIQQQMQLDKVTGYYWKNNANLDRQGTIYEVLSGSAYYDLTNGICSELCIKKILDFFKVQHGVYCIPK